MFKRMMKSLFLSIILTFMFSSVVLAQAEDTDVQEEATENDVDKSKLLETIEEAESTTPTDREDEFNDALNKAKTIYDNENATQEEIDKATEILKDEISFTEIIYEHVDELIVIAHKGSYDKEEANNIVDRLYQIPQFIRDGLVHAGVQVTLIDFRLTDLPDFTYLRGQVPRGWDPDGPTWDDVPGAGGNPMVTRIGYSEPGTDTGHGAINLELHEIAHVIDHYVFDSISEKEAFSNIHKEEAPKFLNDDYHVTYAEEFFAQSFGYYYKNEETKQELKEKAPKTYRFIAKLVSATNKDDLNDAINLAEEITPTDRVTQFNEALNSAIDILENVNATQEEINKATELLNDEISFTEIIYEHVDDLIVIAHKGGYDKEEADNIVERLYQIPQFIRDGLVHAGVQVTLIDFRLTDLPDFTYLRGQVPRGWDPDGPTWDDVPGAGGNPMVTRIGYSEPGTDTGHGAINLELHEIAHVIDHYVFDSISEKETFSKIHKEEAPKFLNDDYHVTYAEEFFAQSFGYYYKNEETKQELKEKAPKTYEFIKNLVTEVDKSKLEDAINKAKDQISDLKQIIEQAEKILNNPVATQSEIDEMVSKLLNAIAAIDDEDGNVDTDEEEDPGIGEQTNNGESGKVDKTNPTNETVNHVEKTDGLLLPSTATPMYNIFAVGIILIAAGIGVFLFNRKRKLNN